MEVREKDRSTTNGASEAEKKKVWVWDIKFLGREKKRKEQVQASREKHYCPLSRRPAAGVTERETNQNGKERRVSDKCIEKKWGRWNDKQGARR